jgi:hypothetical protein
MFPSRLAMYSLLHPGSLLLSRRLASCSIFTGLMPTNDLIGISKIYARWSPTPYPNGITQALLMSMSPDTHKPSMDFVPLKKAAPGLLPV